MRLASVIAVLLAALASPAAHGQSTEDFPNAPVRLLVPFAAGVPATVLDKLSDDIRAVVASAAFLKRVENLGINAYGNRPAELTAWMRREITRWQDVARAANIKPD